MKDIIKTKLHEAFIKNETNDSEKDISSSKYNKIQTLLKNDIFNHSAIIRKLWGDDDATKRSLFRKKLEREKNDNGTPYEFDDTELTKISDILMSTSSEIRKHVGKSGKA